jgi:glycerate kinase
MRVVVAPDKLKGSLTAPAAAEAIARGVRAAIPEAEIDLAPMADGGEGIVDALVAATLGTFHDAVVSGPLGEPVRARFGLLGDGRTAVIEMAAASGLVLVPKAQRDPLRASTRGTGELLRAAIERGARRIILGIGGSATNDGGAGLGQALGFRLLDERGNAIGPGGGSLSNLARIDSAGRDPRLAEVEIAIACDVDNPLCGPRGASAIYGPQKGATPDQVKLLDGNLDHFSRIVARDLGVDVREQPGAGAAGGLGFGLVAFAGGRLQPGAALVIEAIGLAERLRHADLCLTGEGAMDVSSAHGKATVAVARLACSFGCPTMALAGTIDPGAEAVLNEGIDAYFSICPGPIALDEAIEHAGELIEHAAEQAVRAFLAGRRSGQRTLNNGG